MNRLPFFLLVLILASTTSAVEYDCEQGCGTDPENMGRAVCGEDGATYMNKCLAVCQNVTVVNCDSSSNARGEDGLSVTSNVVQTSWDTNTVLSLDAMNRFSGYKLIAKHDRSKCLSRERSSQQRKKDIRLNSSSRLTSRKVRRLTKDGYEYIRTTVSPPSSSGLTHMRASRTRSSWETAERQLAIIGTDDRSFVRDTSEFPFSAIGKIDDSSGGCTATLISRSVALTLASCIHSGPGGEFYDWTNFSPGRFRAENGSIVNPFGTYEIDSVGYYDAYVESAEPTRDYAVVFLNPITRESDGCPHLYPGDLAGFAGWRIVTVADSLLEGSTITGFQWDKPEGEMWGAGPFCFPGFAKDPGIDVGFALHYCDANDFGSAMLTFDVENDSQIMGLHGYQDNAGTVNAGPIIEEPGIFDDIYDWSEREEPPPECPPEESRDDDPNGDPSEDEPDEDECPCGRFRIFCRLWHFRLCFF